LEPYTDEIDLREYIMVLWRCRKMILALFLAAVLASGLISFLVLPPVYEAKATLQINIPPVAPVKGNSALETLLQSLAASQQASMESYRFQATNPMLLQRVQEKLKLDPEKYSFQKLKDAIKVENPENTNLIEITVSNTDPVLAKNLANTLAEEYIAFLNDLRSSRLEQSSSAIEIQLKHEEETLNSVLEEYRQYLSQPRGVKELEAEEQSQLALLTSFKSNLLTTQIELQGTRQALNAAETRLAETPPLLVTTKYLGDEPLLQDIAREKSGRSTEDLAGLALKSEEVNPVYIALAEDVNKYRVSIARLEEKMAALQQAILAIEKKLQSIQAELVQKKAVKERYEVRVSNLEQNYRSLLARVEDTRISSSLDTSTQTRLVAPAVVPQLPVKPNKKLNVAVAGVLSLMLGAFLAFVMEYFTRKPLDLKAGSLQVKPRSFLKKSGVIF